MSHLLSSAKIQSFILAHENDDIFELALKEKRYPDIPIKAVVQQIKARQKAKIKLATWHRTDGIIFPPSLSIEQCSSELTAKYKAEIVGGGTLIDLTGGAGVDSYCFSKAFKNIHYVEKEANLCELAKHNFEKLGAKNIAVHHQAATGFLMGKTLKADCVYLDPARRGDYNSKIFKLEDSQPNILEIKERIFEVTAKILLKTAPMLDIQEALIQLKNVAKVYVVAVKNDCKEVLYLLEKDFFGEAEITTVNLKTQIKEAFSFYKKDELTTEVTLGTPKSYIYEPNAAILKAGAFRSIAKIFRLEKLHANSHLYTSSDWVEDFPGRVFICETTCKYDKKILLKLLPNKKANITVRNFPQTVQQIRKKTGIKPGGDVYLFATTVMDEKPLVLVCRKV